MVYCFQNYILIYRLYNIYNFNVSLPPLSFSLSLSLSLNFILHEKLLRETLYEMEF